VNTPKDRTGATAGAVLALEAGGDMPTYLSPVEFAAVRAAIDISLDISNLSDDVIALPMYRDEAERWVVTMNPLAVTYEPGSDAYLKTQVAAIYACAALITPAVPNLTSEAYGQGFRYTRKEIDIVATQKLLWERAMTALRSVQGGSANTPAVSETPPVRFIFTRGQANRHRRFLV
jgi:hypothetical protein